MLIVPADSKLKINLLEAQAIIDSCKDNVHLNNVDQMVLKEATDEDIVNGQLTVTIHKILGLQNSCGESSLLLIFLFEFCVRKFDKSCRCTI